MIYDCFILLISLLLNQFYEIFFYTRLTGAFCEKCSTLSCKTCVYYRKLGHISFLSKVRNKSLNICSLANLHIIVISCLFECMSLRLSCVIKSSIVV